MSYSTYEFCPPGVSPSEPPAPGDFLLVHRKGFVPWVIRAGTRSRWNHAALAVDPVSVVEALTKGVRETPLTAYHNIYYVLVRTRLELLDAVQAVAFARSCLGKEYGWDIILGIMLRYLTPGEGLWFGMDGTEICSGLVAQALVRGWANFSQNPATMSPKALALAYRVPT